MQYTLPTKVIVFASIVILILINFTPLADSLSIERHNSKYNEMLNINKKRGYFSNNNLELTSVSNNKFVLGEFIIKFIGDVDIYLSNSQDGILNTGIESVDALNKKYHVTSGEKIFKGSHIFSLSNIYKFVIPYDVDISNIAREYMSDPFVVYAEPNYYYNLSIVPDDPYFDQQWSLHQENNCDIDAPEAWDIETGSSDVIIAVLDTGVYYNHQDLAENIWVNEDEIPGNNVDDDGNGFKDDIRGWDFYSNDNNPDDIAGHGTHCAGIASAVTNNSVGVTGISWNCKIMPIRICEFTKVPFTTAAKGIVYATDNGANIISMSWGGYFESSLIRDALNYSYDNGVVLTASAGNENTNKKHYPSGYDDVIGVAATDEIDHKASFSNYGNWITVAAPGVNILSTFTGGSGYELKNGTSMACPLVAGVVGLILSKNKFLSQKAVMQIICNSADRFPPSEKKDLGGGRINAYNALLRGPGTGLAEITSPTHGGDVNNIIDITGLAVGLDFQYYTVEYSKGMHPPSNEWIIIKNSTIPVYDDILASIDTNTMDGEGLYNLRLTVVCNDGIFKDTIWIVVNNEQNTFYVDNDSGQGVDFNSIQESVYSAGSGDTIYVFNGVYSERIVIWKSITLIGEDRDNTIIDGQNKIKVTVYITQGSVDMSGFTFRNGSKGVYIYNSSNNNFHNNKIIRHDWAGMYVVNSDENNIYDNIMIQNCWSIGLDNSSGNKIYDNYFNNSVGPGKRDGYGIYLMGSNDNVIDNCTFTGFSWALPWDWGTRNTVRYCTISHCRGFFRLSCLGCKNNLFHHNNFYGYLPGYYFYQKWNRWDDGSEGNYWHLPRKIDILPPWGIRDIPVFVYNLRNIDWHPLMNPVK
jgi:parallel beta-helix repeat protein